MQHEAVASHFFNVHEGIGVGGQMVAMADQKANLHE